MIVLILIQGGCGSKREIPNAVVSGEIMQWHKIVLTFEGPNTSETDSINPFLDYRMDVLFYKGDEKYQVPGYYAADGNAAETSADSGNKWRVIFRPGNYGLWNYKVTFLKGKNIAVKNDLTNGDRVYFDGANGELLVEPTDKSAPDFRGMGRIRYTGKHYLEFSGTGKYFLKIGADSPENFLGYSDFDNTYKGEKGGNRSGEALPNADLHSYEPHIRDWKEGNPFWKDSKGKGMIGALNYLASKKINSVYMLTNNVGGDGKDVFPWISYKSDFTRFDVSKLAQWEIVFSYMDELGIMCHFVTQETENEMMLDSGNLGLHRKLYYRELIARFGNHLGITWNLGEENGPAPWIGTGQNDRQRKEMAEFIKKTDPYKNFIVVHTLPGVENRSEILNKLLGFPYLDGPSLQTDINSVHQVTLKWRELSAEKGHPWVVCSDEIGPASVGAKPDKVDPRHNEIRSKVLWGNLMAGGGGVEWYFGYDYENNDINCENWRSRENLWDQSYIAWKFFQDQLPFEEMQPADQIVSPSSNYCFKKGDDLLVVYIPEGGASSIRLNPLKSYRITWFDPENGGQLIKTDTTIYSSVSYLNFRIKDQDTNRDWVALVKSTP